MASKPATTTSTTAAVIAATALRVLEHEGADAVSMRRIAQEVGITPMAIYHYFPNRESLLHSITEAEFGNLRGLIVRRMQRGHGEDRLIGMLEAYVDYALERPRLFDYVFSRPRSDARVFPQDFRAGKSPTLTPIAEAVRSAMEEGWLQQDDEWELALELWAVVHGYVALYRAERFSLSERAFRQLCRRALRRLLNGIKA
jgi:AcrR family transcriptional regulator